MSLNSMRVVFNSILGKVIMGIGTLLIVVAAYTGIGAILQNRSMPASNAAQANPAAKVVASVDGVPITQGQFTQQYNQAKQQENMGVMMDGFLRANVLQQLIQRAEAVKAAENAGLTASKAEIASVLNTQLGQVRSQLGLSSSASIDQINQVLQQDGSSVSEIFPTEALRQQVLVQKFQDYLKQTSVPTDAAVQEYYRQVHARHILISNKTRPDAQAKALAEHIIEKLKAGGNFAALAKEYSDDTASKNKGGDDGWISESTPYVPQFLKAALALNAGQVTQQPVLAPQYGYFVIQALAVRENMPKDYAKNKAKYQQTVSQALETQAEQTAMSKVTASPNIDIQDPLLKADYALYQQPNAMSDPSVLADLKEALPNADYTTKGAIYSQIAAIYHSKKDTKQEIVALNNALDSVEDPQIRIMLGDAYRKEGDTKKAIAQYQDASTGAYNQPYIHSQLQKDFTQMGQKALAASEAKWVLQYNQRQKQAKAAQPSAPVGAPAPSMPTP